MKLTPQHWRRLGPSLGLALLCGLGGSLLLHHAWEQWQLARQQLQQAAQSNRQAQAALAKIRGEADRIRQQAARFGTLAERGLVGEERRLDWAELLQESRERRRLPELQYQFSPPQALGPDIAGWRFQASAMQLQLALLHEEDLLHFLADLRRSAQAEVLVRGCDLSRQPREEDDGGDGDNSPGKLLAQCQLAWVTLRPPRAR